MSTKTASNRSYLSDSIRARLPQPARRLARTAAMLADNAQMKIFDSLIGVSTAEPLIPEDSLYKAGGDNAGYGGCQWLSVRGALTKLSPNDEDVFLDIGAGKGKAMLIAARLGYRRVLGVEFDATLAAQARHNIDLARPKLKTRDIQVLNVNAITWTIPDDVSIVFMNCPFIGDTFRGVAPGIIESFDRRPRPLHLVYSLPWEHDWLLTTGRFAMIGVQPRFWPTQPGWWRTGSVVVTYRVIAKDASAADALRLRRWGSRNKQAFSRWNKPNGHVFEIPA